MILTTSPQIIGKNESNTMHTYLYGWYSNQSGNTCTVHIRLTVICVGTTYVGTNKNYWLNLGGYDSGLQSWPYQPLNAGQEYTVAETTWQYSSGESIWAAAGYWTYVFGSSDINLAEATYVPTFYTPPTGINVSISEIYSDGAKFNVSLNSYGNPASATGRYIEAGILGQNSYGGSYRYATASNTSSAAITVNNASGGSLNIKPNTMYYYGGFASNTQANSSVVTSQFVTKVNAPVFSLAGKTSTTATILYQTEADGGYFTKNIEYSLDDGSNWITGAYVTARNQTTGTFVISNLDPTRSYSIKTRVRTTAGITLGPDLNISLKTVKLYAPVNDEGVRINQLYTSVDNVAEPVKKIYGSVSGEAKLMYQGFGHLIYPQT